MNEVIEIWKPIPGYEGLYSASNLGRIKSFQKYYDAPERIKRQSIGSHGYLFVSLYSNGVKRYYPVHLLIAKTFKGDGHELGLLCDHKNNVKLDNNIDNLQWITRRVNNSKDVKNKTSKYIGVHFLKTRNMWASAIRINGAKINLGSFKCELPAHIAYLKALKTVQTKRLSM